MTADHPVRRLLTRVCSAATMARIVDPTLADMRVEAARARWLGYAALARALTVHAVTSVPGCVAHAWREDDRAIPRAASFTIRVALLTALPLALIPYRGVIPFTRARSLPFGGVEAFLLLLPQALVMTLGPSLLCALPVALRDRRPSRRLARRVVALSLVCCLATAALVVWAMPQANQAFRVLASGNTHLDRGPNEEGMTALRERIAILHRTPGGAPAARPVEFLLHIRYAIICAPVPFALLALSLIGTRMGQRRPWLTAVIGLAFYLGLLLPLEWIGQTIAAGSALPAATFAWLPTLAVLAIATGVSRLRLAPPESAR